MKQDGKLEQRTILLVEGDEPTRKMLGKILEAEGFKLLLADTSQRAIEVTKESEHPIGLCIVNFDIPEMSGALLAAELRKNQPTMKFLFTIDGDHGWPIIQKPFPPSVLITKILQVFSST